MKRIMIVAVSVLVVMALVFGASAVMAAKPQNAGKDGIMDVIEKSNGFPSGPHFNLNIHGKKDSFVGDLESTGGHSVFTLEYSSLDNESKPIPEHIQYVSNKKSDATELTVLDKYTEAFDKDPALVQLPREPEGYYVFARILAKPNNSSNDGDASSIILYPNVVVEACNDPDNDDFGGYIECPDPDNPLLALGLIVGPNLYIVDPETETYVRFDPEVTKGKGKSKATDITRLFTYAGWVVDATLDTAEPYGEITIDDIPLGDYDDDPLTPDNRNYNNDGDVDEADVEAWLTDMEASDPQMAWYIEGEWIFNIADLVITEQGLVNDGTKLVQIRFYPVATTEFILVTPPPAE